MAKNTMMHRNWQDLILSNLKEDRKLITSMLKIEDEQGKKIKCKQAKAWPPLWE